MTLKSFYGLWMVQFKKMSLFGPQDKYQLNKPFDVAQGKGFSLLETTIAIAILVAAIIGPMALSSQSIRSASVAKNTITASNLAQEGLELVKNIRLNNRLSDPKKNWMNGLATCGSANGCFIDPKDLTVGACSANCAPLQFDDTLDLYNYDSGLDTMFVRIIRTSDVGSDEVKVSSSVRWSDRFGNHDFTLSTSMLDW